MNRNDKIRGSLIGGAIGDALGYQIEFERDIKDKEITKFLGAKGIISDDTQMTLFTANALLYRETRGSMRGITLSIEDAIYEAYLDWYDTQYNLNKHNKICWLKNITSLNVARAPGNTRLNALSNGVKGSIDKPINNSKGCGGIMRVAPLGLYLKKSLLAGKYGAEANALTHGHPLGIISSYVFSTLIWYLTNTDLTIKEALDEALKQFDQNFNIFDKQNTDYFKDIVLEAINLASSNKNDIDAISTLGEGWVAEEAFAIAIYSCLKYPNNFKDAIICSINHDGDSDSTGSLVGNIMGAYLGYENIPTEYKDFVELKEVILEIADDLSIEVPVGEYNKDNDQIWLDKYVYCTYKE